MPVQPARQNYPTALFILGVDGHAMLETPPVSYHTAAAAVIRRYKSASSIPSETASVPNQRLSLSSLGGK